LILAALLGITPLIPPRAADASAEPTEFSAERAFVHISAIAGSPRPIGSQSNQTARAAIVAELRALGLEPMLQTVVVPDYYGGTEDVPVVNVMARIEPTTTRPPWLRCWRLRGRYSPVSSSATM
jgi:hypothetical protein